MAHLEKRDRQTRAVDLFVKYNELPRDSANDTAANATRREPLQQVSPAPAGVPPSASTVREQWGQFIACDYESIWTLQPDDLGWRNTVKWMLMEEDERAPLGLDCSTYDAFVEFANQSLPRQVCGQ